VRSVIAIAAVGLIAASTTARGTEELVTLPVRDGVTESYLLVYDQSSPPKAVDVSLIGGNGAIDLEKRVRGGVREQPVTEAMRNYVLGREFAREIGDQQ